MFRMYTVFVVLLSLAVMVSSCAVSEERSGPGADGIPQVIVGACAEDQPDCEDTLTDGDLPTGGEDPVAPSSDPSDGALSNGMIVGDGLTIPEAIEYEGSESIAVHGYIVRNSSTVQLCELLAESYPPQCGGASLTLVNVDTIDDMPLIEEGEVQWSPERVVLVGTLAGTELTIESTTSA